MVVSAPSTLPSASTAATSTAATRRPPSTRLIAVPKRISIAAFCACTGLRPSVPLRTSMMAAISVPFALRSSAAAYALSLLVNITARVPGLTA